MTTDGMTTQKTVYLGIVHMVPQFIGAFLVTSIGLIGGSYLWPIIMKHERPPLLETVHDVVVETDPGKKIEDVLGSYTNDFDASAAAQSVSNQVVNTVSTTVQQKVEEIVTRKVLDEVIVRYETLQPGDKEYIKSVICK